MRIVIIANFTRLLDGERENRFSYLADAFAARSHEVELVTTDFYHGTKTARPTPLYERYPFKITMCHEPGYDKNVSIKRLYSHYVWGKNVLKYLQGMTKPDVVYCAIPSLTAAAMERLANRSYSQSNLAVAVSDTYVKRTLSVNKTGAEGLPVFLGNNGALFDTGIGKYSVERQGDEILLCYIGTMSESYDISSVFHALKIVMDNNLSPLPVRFILIGDGAFRSKFEEQAQEVYPNSTFIGRRPYQQMAGLLSSCDIAINPIVKGSAASIINKVGDYALAGIPVINTQESPEYRELVDSYQCGLNCECENPQAIAEAIGILASDTELRNRMGRASRQLAEEKFDRRNTYGNIVRAVEELI